MNHEMVQDMLDFFANWIPNGNYIIVTFINDINVYEMQCGYWWAYGIFFDSSRPDFKRRWWIIQMMNNPDDE